MRHARGLMLVLLVSCTNEVTVASNTCGNYVLEPGEDCDQPGDACTKDCRLACSAMVACPDTMACGTDQICHAGTGRFHTSPITHAFNATSFVLTDLDEDGAHDALGVTSGSVAVGHGGADPFATSEQLAAPFSTGASSLGDFTGDGKADVLIPTAGGVAGFETSSGTAQPAVFPFAVAAPGTIHVRAATTSTGGLVSLDFQNGNVPGAQLSLDGGAATYPCAALFGQPKGRSLHPYVDGARVRVPMILSGALEQSMPTKTVPAGICIDSPGAASGSQRIAYSGIGNTIAAGEAFFAQVPGSGACPALIAPVTVTLLGEGALVIPGAGVPGGCTVATPVLVGPSQNSVFVPGAPLAAIRLDIAGGPQIGIITAKGVSTVDLTSKTHVVVSQATRAWTVCGGHRSRWRRASGLHRRGDRRGSRGLHAAALTVADGAVACVGDPDECGGRPVRHRRSRRRRCHRRRARDPRRHRHAHRRGRGRVRTAAGCVHGAADGRDRARARLSRGRERRRSVAAGRLRPHRRHPARARR